MKRAYKCGAARTARRLAWKMRFPLSFTPVVSNGLEGDRTEPRHFIWEGLCHLY